MKTARWSTRLAFILEQQVSENSQYFIFGNFVIGRAGNTIFLQLKIPMGKAMSLVGFAVRRVDF
jgi:hypothetical protein